MSYIWCHWAFHLWRGLFDYWIFFFFFFWRLPQQIICLQLILPLVSSSVTSILCMCSFTSSMNLLWGLAFHPVWQLYIQPLSSISAIPSLCMSISFQPCLSQFVSRPFNLSCPSHVMTNWLLFWRLSIKFILMLYFNLCLLSFFFFQKHWTQIHHNRSHYHHANISFHYPSSQMIPDTHLHQCWV